jgi:sigma-54 specific flagellar transcriptional regulator A
MAELAALVLALGADNAREQTASAAVNLILPTGESAAIRRVNRLIHQVAGYDSNVLVLGESGTGKEVVARAIHEVSARRRRPFVPINCGAIPAELLESELFGHEKGSFTGALAARKGRFEIAEGGTIFLDEIGDMNPTMQVKLLRVLQERMFERVGSCASQRCDVRIIAATHRNLEDSIAKGSFREDLYYRLNVVPIEVPALRQRSGDLPVLITVLAERIAAAGRPLVRFSVAALQALQAYRWPGNVRELANLIERMAVQCGAHPVTTADLPERYRPADWPAEPTVDEPEAASVAVPDVPHVATATPAAAMPVAAIASAATAAAITPTPSPAVGEGLPAMAPALVDMLLEPIPEGFDLRAYLESLEQRLIERALRSSGGTVAQAARVLGLRRTTLVEKLRKYAPDSDAAAASDS